MKPLWIAFVLLPTLGSAAEVPAGAPPPVQLRLTGKVVANFYLRDSQRNNEPDSKVDVIEFGAAGSAGVPRFEVLAKFQPGPMEIIKANAGLDLPTGTSIRLGRVDGFLTEVDGLRIFQTHSFTDSLRGEAGVVYANGTDRNKRWGVGVNDNRFVAARLAANISGIIPSVEYGVQNRYIVADSPEARTYAPWEKLEVGLLFEPAGFKVEAIHTWTRLGDHVAAEPEGQSWTSARDLPDTGGRTNEFNVESCADTRLLGMGGFLQPGDRAVVGGAYNRLWRRTDAGNASEERKADKNKVSLWTGYGAAGFLGKLQFEYEWTEADTFASEEGTPLQKDDRSLVYVNFEYGF